MSKIKWIHDCSVTETEKFIIDQYRKGARVEVTISPFNECTKEEAYELLNRFPRVVENGNGRHTWLANYTDHLQKLQVNVFYKEKTLTAGKRSQ